MLSFLCPACRQKLTAAPEAAGRAMKCPRCQQRLVAPQPPATVPSGPIPPPGGVPTVTVAPTPLSQHETRGVSQSGARTDAPPGDRGLNLGDILSPPRGPNEMGRLGPYSVLKVLGAGGMGVVLHARDNQLERFVALKVMRPSHASKAGRERFLREARAAAAIEHDHIIPIFQVGEERGVPFLAMPLLQGEALDMRLRREGKLPTAEVLRIGKEIAEGLAAAHERGLIHRDIKPANVWLEGKTGRVKILDFGLARAVGGEVAPPSEAPPAPAAMVALPAGIAAQLTQAGSILGTPSYMAPEQAAGKSIDARCDLFSLGCVLYVLSTGQLPFTGKNLSAILAAVAGHVPAAPRQLNPGVPAALSDLIVHLLAKDPSARPASAAAVAEALDRLRPAASGPSGWRRRQRAILAAGLLLGVASVVLLALLLTRTPRGTKEIVDRNNEALDDSADVPRPSFEELSRRHSPLDDWKHETLSEVALALAGRGDPAKAPAELVGVLGDPGFRLLHPMSYPRYSPNGQILAVGNAAELRLFQSRTGRLLRTLTGHSDRVSHAAFTFDSRKVATCSQDGTVKLWDVASGKMLWTTPSAGKPTWGVAFSPDEPLLATGGDDGKVRLRDAATGAERRVLPGHRGRVFHTAFRPDGRLLASSCAIDGTVRLWDPNSGELKATLQHVPDPGPKADELLHLTVAFSRDGRLLATGNDVLLKLWDATTFQEIRAVKTPAMFLAFHPDHSILFTARHRYFPTDPHAVQRFDTVMGEALAPLTLHSRGQWGTYDLGPDGRILAAAEVSDKALRQYDVDTGKPLVAEPGHTREVIGVAFSPDGKHLASGSRDNTIKIWDLATRKELRTLTGHSAEVRRVAFSPNGKLLASCSFDRTVRIWDLATGRRLRTLAEHTGAPHNLAFSPDGKRLASAGLDATIRIWNVAEGWEVHVLRGHKENVEGVAFSLDGQTLASASKDGTVRLWDARTGEPKAMRRHSARLVSLAYLPDGRTLAVGGHDRLVWLWDIDSGEIRNLPLAEHPVVYGLSVRGDGRFLAGSGSDGGVTLWDLQATPPRQRTFFFHTADPWVGDVAFSPEGRHLATANPDGTISILKVPSTLPRP